MDRRINRKDVMIGLSAALAGTFLAPKVAEAGRCRDRCKCNSRGQCCYVDKYKDQFGQCWVRRRYCGLENSYCDCGGCP